MRVVGTAGASAAAKLIVVLRTIRSAAALAPSFGAHRERRASRPLDDKRGPGPWAGPRHSPQLSKSSRRICVRKSKQTNKRSIQSRAGA